MISILLLSLALTTFSLPSSNLGTICVTKADCTELLTCNKNVCSILDEIVSVYLYDTGNFTTETTVVETSTTTTTTDTAITSTAETSTTETAITSTTEIIITETATSTRETATTTTHKFGVSRPTSGCSKPNLTETGTVIDNVYISIYGFDDNDDGSGNFGVATISNPVIHQIATESTGTYESPSTFASDSLFRVFNVGDIIYIPKFRKYYILEDTCVECTTDQTMGNVHIDLYIGGNTKLEGQTLLDCEDRLDTGGFNTIIIHNPPSNLPVNTVVLYDETTHTCNPTTFN